MSTNRHIATAISSNSKKIGIAMYRNKIRLKFTANVYTPGCEANLVMHYLKNKTPEINGCKVLDYGTGSGILAIAAKKLGANVTAIDCSEKSIALAKHNALRNKAFGIDFRLSNSLENVSDIGDFDLIIASLPYHKGTPFSSLSKAFLDKNLQMRNSLFNSSEIKQNTKIIFTYSNKARRRISLKSPGVKIESKFKNSRVSSQYYIAEMKKV